MARVSARATSVALLAVACVAPIVVAQQPPRVGPADTRLRQLYNSFLTESIAIANDYMSSAERSRTEGQRRTDYEKARIVCQKLLAVQPDYAPAQQIIERIKQMESKAESVTFEVDASQNWQDTGVRVLQGKPVVITPQGTWTMNMTLDTDAAGFEIPKEVARHPLGGMIGLVYTGDVKEAKTFAVGAKHEFFAEKPGALYLKINDIDLTDNSGKIRVLIEGTFETATAGR